MGNAKIDRGLIKLEFNFNASSIQLDQFNINKGWEIITEMKLAS
jgi:hypothetical protein